MENERELRSQSGVTLVELLLGIAVSSIVFALLAGLLTASFKQAELSQSHINLRQEGNYIVSQLHQLHRSGNYILCYESGSIYADGKPLQSLYGGDAAISGMETGEGGQVLFEHEGRTLTGGESSSCAEVLQVNRDYALRVSLVLTDPNGREVPLETTVDRLKDFRTEN